MKKCILALYNLKYMIQSGNKLFLIVLFSMTISVFGILFYSGYFLYNYDEASSGSKLSVTVQTQAESREICNLISELELQNIDFQRVNLFPPESEESKIIGEYNLQYNSQILLGENYSLHEERAYIILAEYMVDFIEDGELPIGKHINVDGYDFEILGIVPITDYDYYLVPIDYYAQNFPVEKLEFLFSRKLTKSEEQSIRNLIEDKQFVIDYKIRKSSSPFASSDFITIFVQILLIFVTVIINIFCMTYYWIMHFKKNYRIYAVCGAGTGSIIEMILIQTIIIMFSGVVLGNIIFSVFMAFTTKYELVYQKEYTSYLVVSIVVFSILVCFSFVLAKKATKTDVIYRTME